MIEKFLPIGSVVMLKDATKELMIIGYCMKSEENGDKIYDYLGCVYPIGYISPEVNFLFDHESIDNVLYKGFEKEKKAIEQYLKLQMQNYEIAYVGDRKITWKKQERNTIDTTRLKKEHPEIVAGYMKTTTSRVLKV